MAPLFCPLYRTLWLTVLCCRRCQVRLERVKCAARLIALCMHVCVCVFALGVRCPFPQQPPPPTRYPPCLSITICAPNSRFARVLFVQTIRDTMNLL